MRHDLVSNSNTKPPRHVHVVSLNRLNFHPARTNSSILAMNWVGDGNNNEPPCVKSGVSRGMVSMEEQFQRRSAKASRHDTVAATAASHTVDINCGCLMHIRTCSRLSSSWRSADQQDDFMPFFLDQWRRVFDVHLNLSRSHWLKPLSAFRAPIERRISLRFFLKKLFWILAGEARNQERDLFTESIK